MIKTVLHTTLFAAALTLGTATLTPSAQAQDMNEEEIEQIVENYILNNGDKIIQAVENFQQKQQQEEQQQAQEILKQNEDYLYEEDHPAIGPKNADATIVEFFDYNCGYCKKAFSDIQTIVQTDKTVRFIMMDLPILGPTSLTAAKWGYAAHKQGKYLEYHTALMEHRGQKTESELERIAKDVGLDVEQMKKDAESAETQAYISKSAGFARQLGISGTPGFIAGDEILRGYIGLDGMKRKIEELKNQDE